MLQAYTDRAVFTAGLPRLYIGINNAEPSGIYQDNAPPTTGKEYIYKLCNDPDAEGFPTWQIQYNVGGVNVTKP